MERFELGTRSSDCAEHGSFEESGHRIAMFKREFWSGCPVCAAEKVERERAEAAAAEARRAADIREDAIGQAAIPLRFRSRTFDAFTADTPEKQRALTVARDYAEDFDNNLKTGRGLVFSGLPGTGKSHLAAAIALHLIDNHSRRWVQYTSCMGLIRAVRETWRSDSDSSERRVLNKFGREIDLLMIDEVGVQYGTDSEQTILFEILDRRYAEMRPTILLTNQGKDGLRKYVGERVYDRLIETSRMVVFDWESYRPQARREQA
ncbi:ATP-binding protein [Pelomonas sp. V22]|nr:ATP-binding protein [Pelomonas sp. V22]